MTPRPDDDDALATAFSGREPWAFETAYRRYAPLLYSTAYNVVGSAEEAQDCVHDALARIWQSPGAYSRSRGEVRSFLVVCVRNEAISRLRKRDRRARIAERLAAEPQEHQELGAGDPIERDRVRRALRDLPAEQRVALELAYYGGRTQSEIAAELNEPLGTVKARIRLGLRRLATVLG